MAIEKSFMKNDPVQITREKKTKIEPVETGKTIEFSAEETEILGSLADLLEYPTKDWFEAFEVCKDLVLLNDFEESSYFSDFCLEINQFSLDELQERYTRTFDLNPVCALEVGYHLFGEDYKRGEFLANMRATENPYELGQEFQLPDYLPVVLRLLTKLDDTELRAQLIGYCLLPALKQMRVPFKKKENPYGNVIFFVDELLKSIAKKSLPKASEVKTARYQYA